MLEGLFIFLFLIVCLLLFSGFLNFAGDTVHNVRGQNSRDIAEIDRNFIRHENLWSKFNNIVEKLENSEDHSTKIKLLQDLEDCAVSMDEVSNDTAEAWDMYNALYEEIVDKNT